MATLKTPVSQLVASAREVVEEIDTADAIKLVEDENILFVDLRDIRERQRSGFIPGSFHCPRGMAEFWVDPDSPYYKPVFGEDKKFIFHCASGWHLKDGFIDWEKSDGPIETMPDKK